MTKTEGKTLESVVSLLGDAYKNWKTWEEAKNAHRDSFFELADKAVGDEGLAVRLIDVDAASEAQARKRIALHYPGWLIEEIRPRLGVVDDRWEAVLKEDPAFKPFSFEHEGVRYARTVRRGSVMIDDAWLKEAEPDLYEAVTFKLPWGERITVPLDKLTSHLIGRLTRYIYHMPPKPALAAPRPVETEER